MPLAAEIAPHRALYSMTLGSVRNDSGVTDAKGVMVYQWGETCDGWTIEQRYRLKLHYSGAGDTDVVSTLHHLGVEGRAALSLQRSGRRATATVRRGHPRRGTARRPRQGRRRPVFEAASRKPCTLAPGVLFPSAHTILLIDRARAGATFVSRQVFDGSAEENAVQVSALHRPPNATADRASAKLEPACSQRPGWRVRLAFFPADAKAEVPDYELGMMLLDNGVSRDMDIDYGDYIDPRQARRHRGSGQAQVLTVPTRLLPPTYPRSSGRHSQAAPRTPLEIAVPRAEQAGGDPIRKDVGRPPHRHLVVQRGNAGKAAAEHDRLRIERY